MKIENAPVGSTTVLAMRGLIAEGLDGGWVPSKLLWPRMLFPYKDEFDRGEWNAYQMIMYHLKFHISREGRSDKIDHNLIVANSAINNASDKFIFPSTEGKMRESLSALDRYLAALSKKKNFYARANSLYELIDSSASVLGGSLAELTDPEIGFLQGYGPFNYTKGQVRVVLTMLKAVKIDFAEVLATKHGSEKQLDDVIKALETALTMNPWIPLNGETGLKSDLSYLANEISKAQQILNPLADTLRNA